MKTSALESKTVRPGAMRYTFYASDRRPVSQSRAAKPRRSSHKAVFVIILLLVIGGGAAYAFRPTAKPAPASTASVATTSPKPTPAKTAPAVTAPAVAVNYCAGNALASFVKVSISERHMWACQDEQVVYDSPVVTGIEYLAADRTPIGTYHVYAKYTDKTLRGCDTTGCWDDPVSYWMPFLTNKYGQYGFHDATWRSAGDFGNIDPNSADASHGCVELPLSTAKWLYGWVTIGTTVSIVS